jgi:L-lactate dehydrogenase complex protein LldE
VREFSEFVADNHGGFQLPLPAKATYHPSCHLARGLGLDDPPRRLLRAVTPLEVVPLPDEGECCGFGGTFSVRYDSVSGAMMDDKLDRVTQTGADTLIVTDPGCMLQLDGGAHRRGCPFKVRHLAEVLAESTAEKP